MKMTFDEEITETVTLTDGHDADFTSRDGRLAAVRTQKADSNNTAELSMDTGCSAYISATRLRRVDKFEAERGPVESLVKALNTDHATHYATKEKLKEDNDYADRVLMSAHDQPNEVIVQVCNLDPEIIAGLNRDGVFRGTRELDELAKLVRKAIGDKALVDPELKTKTILLLAVPVPLGKLVRQSLTQQECDTQGFREVWVSPFHEEAFHLRRHQEHVSEMRCRASREYVTCGNVPPLLKARGNRRCDENTGGTNAVTGPLPVPNCSVTRRTG
jgi:hypothetical protein